MPDITTIKECRVCGNKELVPIISLGNLFVSNFVDAPESKFVKGPLDLVLCSGKKGCSLLQLKHTISSHLMYRNYWYRSGMNRTMTLALADIANKAENVVKLANNDIVLDIGCNDGTLLRAYRTKGIRLVGFEPARNLVPYAEDGATKIINDFFNFESFQKEFGKEKAKIITSIAMFYDLDEPNKFVSDVAKCLDRNGLWVIEMQYLPVVLLNNAFDCICHEHLEIYSLKALENLLGMHGLEVFDVELNNVNGGSIRTYIRYSGGSSIKPFEGASERLKKQRAFEQSLGLDKNKIYREFAERVNAIKEKVVSFIKTEKAKGKKIFVYGASTKGNTLLQYFGLDYTLIEAAAEKNPDKWGKKTIGTMIPIVSEEEARRDKPDYFLVLPWHFLKEFKEREKEFLRNGGKFIVPLPEFKILGAEDL